MARMINEFSNHHNIKFNVKINGLKISYSLNTNHFLIIQSKPTTTYEIDHIFL